MLMMNQDHEQSSLTDSPMESKRKLTIKANSFVANEQSQDRVPPVPLVDTTLPASKPVLTKAGEKEKVFAPRKVDVLLGRGKPFQSHPGNQTMLRLVDDYRARYLQAERREKHAIVEGVMKAIRETGGRFLSRVDYENYWVEVTHSIAYRKVGHAFRSKARRTGESSGSHNSEDADAASDATPNIPSVSDNHAALAQADLLFGGARMFPGRNSTARLREAEAPAIAHIFAGAAVNPLTAAAPLQAVAEINPRISFPPTRLAMDLNLRLRGGNVGGLPAATAGLPTLSSSAPLGGLLPTLAYDQAMMYRQRQQQLLAQQQLISGGNSLMLRGDQSALRSELERAQLIQSLRRQAQNQGGDLSDQRRNSPFFG